MAVMNNEAVQPYQRIVQDVRDKIRSGHLAAHDKLPSTRELAEEYGVAHGTVQRALVELRTAGLIYSHQGRGSYISGSVKKAGQDPTARIKMLEEQVAELGTRLERLERGKDA